MIIDGYALDDGAAFASDVCVIGAGAAGITLALALAKLGLTVNLLESGGFGPEPETQRLYDGPNIGTPYSPAASRLRFFGGSTNHWGGLCHRLDEMDFLPRPWIEHSGWPIRKAELDPYYDQALGVLEIPPRHDFAEVEGDTDVHPRLLGPQNELFEPVLWLKSPPTRMGKRYRPDIADSAQIRCYLHTNAVEIVPNPAANAVVRVNAKTLVGKQLTFSARQFVVSAGVIENARLLLLSDTVVPHGIGNRSDLVGRYFMEHLSYFVGRMTVTSPPGTQSFQEEYVQQRSKQDLAGVCDFFFGFGLARAPRERHRLLGFSVNALPPAPSGDATAGAVEELVTSPHQGKPVRSYSLGVIAERAPNPNSRVFLSDERDALGSRKIVVDIQPSPCDRRSAHKGLRLFALELARSGHGRAQLQEADESQLLFLMGHHMGTTRMADDPARGVADRNGRVHGMSNLYLAGSSLFVTGGFANPTLTIIALALRQAEHIKRVRAGT